jgi:hypothetical protein
MIMNTTDNLELTELNKIYLELSQFVTAKNKNDLLLEEFKKTADRRLILIRDIFNCEQAFDLPSELKKRIADEFDY